MTNLASPIAVLDEAPKTLGLSRVTAPFSRTWSESTSGVKVIVSSTADFLSKMPHGVVHRRTERLLLLTDIEKAKLDNVVRRFATVVVTKATPDLVAILRAENRAELFIQASYDSAAKQVVLHRGDLSVLVVPLGWFTPTPSGPKPDTQRVHVVDGGQTLALGEYEAAADAILYEFDPEYRKLARKRAAERDTSFGGSLRRLRIQKGLSRSDFKPELSAKTVARIERGEVGEPHEATMEHIAKKLGVRVEEIASY